MEFKEFRSKIQEHFAEMTKDVRHLFEVEELEKMLVE